MYVARVDVEFFQSNCEKIYSLHKQYKQRFGKTFPCFSYSLFCSEGEKCAMQVYMETLEKALREDKPYEYPPDYKFDY